MEQLEALVLWTWMLPVTVEMFHVRSYYKKSDRDVKWGLTFTHRTVPSPPRVITRSTFGCRSEISLSAFNKKFSWSHPGNGCKNIFYHLPKFVQSRRNMILIKVLPSLVAPRKRSILCALSTIWSGNKICLLHLKTTTLLPSNISSERATETNPMVCVKLISTISFRN